MPTSLRGKSSLVVVPSPSSSRFGYPPEAGLGPGELQAIRVALRGLPPRQRQAVVLRYYADLPDAEIARSTGISPGAPKSHLHRRMVSLAKSLEALR